MTTQNTFLSKLLTSQRYTEENQILFPTEFVLPYKKNEHFLMFGNFILRQRDTISTRIQKKMHYIKSINKFLCHPVKQVFKPQTKHNL